MPNKKYAAKPYTERGMKPSEFGGDFGLLLGNTTPQNAAQMLQLEHLSDPDDASAPATQYPDPSN